MIDWIFDMGRLFRQSDIVIHLAVEILDRFFLHKDTKFEFNERNIALYTMTCFLIASKHDELDDNIPLIKDLIRYFCRELPT